MRKPILYHYVRRPLMMVAHFFGHHFFGQWTKPILSDQNMYVGKILCVHTQYRVCDICLMIQTRDLMFPLEGIYLEQYKIPTNVAESS